MSGNIRRWTGLLSSVYCTKKIVQVADAVKLRLRVTELEAELEEKGL